MKAEVGYFSIVQFCPDAARKEAANVGVVLLCPSLRYLGVKTSTRIDRVRRFFRDRAPDRDRLRLVIGSVKRRLMGERGRFLNPEDLEAFAGTLANYMRLTATEAVAVRSDPDLQLAELFERLVGGKAARAGRKDFDPLAGAFRDESVAKYIEKDVTVQLPTLGKPFTAPYGFLNGSFNLIKPVRFGGLQPTDLVRRAGQYAVEGDLLSRTRHPDFGELKLIVVGQFTPSQAGFAGEVGHVLEQNHARLYRESQIGELVQEIRERGRPLPLRLSGEPVSTT
ncbi:MAG: DUF3037 domain-containing protein [Gemmataceae bacterium]